jgi:hypothetical protein
MYYLIFKNVSLISQSLYPESFNAYIGVAAPAQFYKVLDQAQYGTWLASQQIVTVPAAPDQPATTGTTPA